MAHRKFITRLKAIHFGGYPFDVLLAVGVPAQRIERFLKRRGVQLTDNIHESLADFTSRGRVTTLPDGAMVLRIKEWDARPFHHAVLAHEIAHCVFKLFSHIGVDYCEASEEAFTYAIQDLTQRVYIELGY